MSENIEYCRNQLVLARTELKNLRQQLSALKHEHQNEIKHLKSVLNNLRCMKCADPATHVESNGANQAPASEDDGILYRPIGFIETCFQNKRGVPRQPSVFTKAKGVVVIDTTVFNNPEHALNGLEEFSHMWIIFHFHATESTSVPAKVAPPRLRGERRGVFSTRSPHRPCPIGLSLVKVQGIEGNKIHFTGVDMVNGTPVLDIKPYIPQYDYPTPQFNGTSVTMVRPPTEGNSEIAENLTNLQISSDDLPGRSPRLTNPLGVDTSPYSPLEDEISPGSEIHDATPSSPSAGSPSSVDLLDGETFESTSSSRRLDTERGAPDGQERFTPPQSAHMINVSHDGIRVAPWISNPPSQTYEVRFTNDALARLQELIGDRTSTFRSNIQTLLSEDPRSHYVRTRYPDHEYSCVLEDVSISCVFDNVSSTCSIIAVRSAEEMQ